MLNNEKTPLWSTLADAEINDVAISASGDVVVAGSGDKKIYCLDQEGKLLWSYSLKGTVSTVAISADAALISAGSNLGEIVVLNREGKLLWQYKAKTSIRHIAVSDDKMLYASYGGVIHRFNGENGFSSNTYAFSSEIENFTITNSGESIAICTSDNTISLLLLNMGLWDIHWSYTIGDTVKSIAISTDGKFIAAGSMDTRIYLFDEKGALLWKYPTGAWILNLAISTGCSYIAGASSDNNLYLLDQQGKLLQTFQCPDIPKKISLSADGRYIALGLMDNTVCCLNHYRKVLWNCKIEDQINYRGNNGTMSIAMSSDGSSLVTGLGDGRILFFDNNRPVNIPETKKEPVSAPITVSEPVEPVKKYDKIDPLIQRLIKSHTHPLDHLPEFYEYLELTGFTLNDDNKQYVRETIQKIIEQERKLKRLKDLEEQLFKNQNDVTPLHTDTSQSVIPVSIVKLGSTCQVCLSEFSSAEPGAVTCPHCNSIFHYRCITKWVNKNGTCPICKKDLKV